MMKYLDSEEFGHLVFKLHVQRRGAELGARRARGEPVGTRGRHDGRLGDCAGALREAQVVVRTQVQAPPLHAAEPKDMHCRFRTSLPRYDGRSGAAV